MPEKKVCLYCYKVIDEEKEDYTPVPGRREEFAHTKCYERTMRKISSSETEPFSPGP